jgi:asparaginyl-tRNA synthetase
MCGFRRGTRTIVPPQAKRQRFEMPGSALRVIGWVEYPDTYPIRPKQHSLEYLRAAAHLPPRTNVIAARGCSTAWRW